MTATIRVATRSDAARIAEIYNEGIADRSATFETEPRSPGEVMGWLVDGFPVLVAEHEGRVAGFARLSEYSDRCVYQGIGEHGVYVSRDARGLGLGRSLLDALAREAAGTILDDGSEAPAPEPLGRHVRRSWSA